MKIKNEKVKNILWILFILLAFLVTGFNVYKLWGMYNGNTYQQEEDYVHDHNHDLYDDLEVIHVDFTGVEINGSETDIQSTTYAANNSSYYYASNIICKNTENGDIYWYSDTDNSVYRTSAGNSEKLFEKQASGLAQYDGKLYFISYEDEKSQYEPLQFGHIWMYDFASKTLSIFSDVMANSYIISNGQFYCMALSEAGICPHTISYDGSYQEIDYIYCGSYKNYHLAYDYRYFTEFLPLYLIDSETGELIQLVTNNVYISEQSIYKDSLYYIYYFGNDETENNNGDICSVNLLTGEKKAYGIEGITGHTHELSYNFANDKLYLLSENTVAEIDLLTDKVTRENIRNTQSHLYSDGETIYLVTKDSDGKNQLASFNDFASFYKLLK